MSSVGRERNIAYAKNAGCRPRQDIAAQLIPSYLSLYIYIHKRKTGTRATRDWLTPPLIISETSDAPRGEPKREINGWKQEGRTESGDSPLSDVSHDGCMGIVSTLRAMPVSDKLRSSIVWRALLVPVTLQEAVATGPHYTFTTTYTQPTGQDRSLLGIAFTFRRGEIKLPIYPWKTESTWTNIESRGVLPSRSPSTPTAIPSGRTASGQAS